MKASPNKNRGFSTVEMLIAMAVMIMVLSAVILLAFGSQSLLADSQTDAEALSLAQLLLEAQQALARQDFNLVEPTTTVQTIGGLAYTEQLQSTLQSDYLTKKLVATVSWTGDHDRSEYVSLTTYVTNFENVVGANTCDSNPTGDWTHPTIHNSTTALAQLVGDPSGTYTVTGVDAYFNRLYVTATANSPTAKNFFIFNTIDPSNPTLLGSLDTSGSGVSSGGAAVVAATSTGSNYAYVANSYAANFNTCTPNLTGANGGNCAQLQIIDITDPANPVLKVSYEIPTTTLVAHVTGSGGAAGNSIFYKNGYIYLGLTKTTTGPEFNIIDVHNPLNPVWVAGYQLGYTVNSIFVKDDYAYVAHPTDSGTTTEEQVTVFDVSDPTHPKRVSDYHAPDNQGNGKALYAVGNTLYLGRTVNTTSSDRDFYILNNTDPASLLGNNPNAPQPPGQKVSTSINGLVVRGGLAFLLGGTSGTPGSLIVSNISNPAQVVTQTTVALPSNSSGAALDCEGNTLYAASNDSSGRGYLSDIYP